MYPNDSFKCKTWKKAFRLDEFLRVFSKLTMFCTSLRYKYGYNLMIMTVVFCVIRHFHQIWHILDFHLFTLLHISLNVHYFTLLETFEQNFVMLIYVFIEIYYNETAELSEWLDGNLSQNRPSIKGVEKDRSSFSDLNSNC